MRILQKSVSLGLSFFRKSKFEMCYGFVMKPGLVYPEESQINFKTDDVICSGNLHSIRNLCAEVIDIKKGSNNDILHFLFRRLNTGNYT